MNSAPMAPPLHDGEILASRAYAAQPQDYSIAVIIPTYNRVEALLVCLAHLEQQHSSSSFEVVVVDDGSTDETAARIQAYAASTALHLRYMRQANAGPARARNQAIAMIHAPVCLMIGDDIFAHPQMVEVHRALHQQHPEAEAAVLGLTRWDESRQQVTRFMRWLDESGIQFAYGELEAGGTPSWRHFYTSNLSLKTELLRRFPFDERFKKAAMEDLELGYRIHHDHGLRMIFAPAALATHLHPTDFLQASRRMFGVGASSWLFARLWPNATEPGKGSGWPQRMISELLVRNPPLLALLTRITAWICRRFAPSYLLRVLLLQHFSAGYRAAEQGRAEARAILNTVANTVPPNSPAAEHTC